MADSNPGEEGGYGVIRPSAKGDDDHIQELHDRIGKMEERQKDMVPQGDIRFLLDEMREEKQTAERINAPQVAEVIDKWMGKLEQLIEEDDE
jgi:hypothetical protein